MDNDELVERVTAAIAECFKDKHRLEQEKSDLEAQAAAMRGALIAFTSAMKMNIGRAFEDALCRADDIAQAALSTKAGDKVLAVVEAARSLTKMRLSPGGSDQSYMIDALREVEKAILALDV